MNSLIISLLARIPLAPQAVLIQQKKARLLRGQLPHALLSDLSELSERNHISHACIHASGGKGKPVKLRMFGIPDELEQRLRNIWLTHV